ncbi:uncharacterized protein GGS25DRAFT_161072 [Hypoxylon fragiforme]|uniref:uncharacterized protein n=1 Tax=Hypoxylon fragiforme TaxID=63214 RepID=UPI0020C68C6B|nr:uncharacterized protein GGS25DRAFT_161072 [Hypoxylon fragiforme]KAI2610721.1 hypothetical protein GGS25DRAFT_161072 [Hypoxylon fragiforme]
MHSVLTDMIPTTSPPSLQESALDDTPTNLNRPQEQWNKRTRFLRLVRLILSMVFLFVKSVLDYGGYAFSFGDVQMIFMWFSVWVGIFWDLISQLFAFGLSLRTPLGIVTMLELLLITIHFCSFGICIFNAIAPLRRDVQYYYKPNIVYVLLWIPILPTNVLLTRRYILAYLPRWRIARNLPKTKPRIVFTKAGTPVAVHPKYTDVDALVPGRLSVDSLIHNVEDENAGMR